MLALMVLPAAAQTPEVLTFPNGFSVTGPFLTFYKSIPDPYAILGYPISNAERAEADGRQVQYFQRARLEIQDGKVVISNLGEVLYTPGGPLAPVRNSGPACRRFSTGQNVCYGFLQFYDRNGGESYFGLPISGVELENGRKVQYFEKVRLEWRAESADGRFVHLADLGKIYFDMVHKGINPIPPSNTKVIGDKPLDIKVRAFVQHALLAPNTRQTLYIVVQDQSLNPVQNAATEIVVTMPDGTRQTYRPMNTDVNGITVFTLNVGAAEVKQIVRLDVTASLPELALQHKTSTWFRVWW